MRGTAPLRDSQEDLAFMLQSWTNAVTLQVVGDRSPEPHHRRGDAPRLPPLPQPRLRAAAAGAGRVAQPGARLRVGSLRSQEIQAAGVRSGVPSIVQLSVYRITFPA